MILGLLTALALAAEGPIPADPAAVRPKVELRLDLGPEDGTVLDGFAELTPWSSSDGRAAFVDPGSPSGDDWPDPLVGDSIRKGTIRLQIPAGTYRMAALFADDRWGARPRAGRQSGLRSQGELLFAETVPEGDSFFSSRFYGHNPWPVFEPGEDAWDRQLVRSWSWRTETVMVPEGGLDLEIHGEPLAALIVTEIGLASLEVELAQIDARRGEWWRAYHPPVVEALPRALDSLAGVEVLEWDERPSLSADAARPQVHRSEAAAPGRRVTGLLAVHGPDEGVSVRIEPPPGWDAELFEVSWLDANEERIVRVRPHILHPIAGGGGPLHGGQGLVPLVGWVLTVPEHALPSTQAVRITVQSGEDTATADIDVRVRDLVLEDPDVQLGFWVDLDGATAGIYGPDSEQARALWSATVDLMRARGAKAMGLRGTFFPGDWFDAEGPYPIDRFSWAADAWLDAGGRSITWVDPAFSLARSYRRTPEDQPPLSAEAVASLGALGEAAAAKGASIFVIDEEIARRGPAAIPRLTRMLELADEALQVPLSGAVTHPGGWDLAADHLDIVYTNRRPYLSQAHRHVFDDRRASAWSYNLGLGRTAPGRLQFHLQTDGQLLWHFNEHQGDPYIQLRGKDWMWALARPDRGDILPLVRLELFSEGVQDLNVLTTLAARVHELQGRKRRRIREEVARGCAILEVAGSSLEGVRPGEWADQPLTDSTSLDRLRAMAGDQAEVLSRWSRRQRLLRRGRPVPEVPRGVPASCGNGSAPATAR